MFTSAASFKELISKLVFKKCTEFKTKRVTYHLFCNQWKRR